MKNSNNYNQNVIDFIIKHIQKIEEINEIYFLSLINQIVSSWDFYSDLNIEVNELSHFIQNKQQINQNYLNYFAKYVNDNAKKLLDEIKNFRELNDIYKNHKTYEIYKKAENKYRIAYFLYLFLALIGVCYGLNWSMDLIKSKSKWITEYGIDIYDFWAIKITAIFIVITGVTFCLKQAIHHQRKKDKAEQTRLELEALPTYMFNFSDEQKNEVYKELTGKYFGRDFDNEGYQAMSDIIQEQIKLSNEVLKSVIAKN